MPADIGGGAPMARRAVPDTGRSKGAVRADRAPRYIDSALRPPRIRAAVPAPAPSDATAAPTAPADWGRP